MPALFQIALASISERMDDLLRDLTAVQPTEGKSSKANDQGRGLEHTLGSTRTKY